MHGLISSITARLLQYSLHFIQSQQRILEAGHIKVLASSPRYIVPKVYFLEFITSRRFIDAWSNSEGFIKVLEDLRRGSKVANTFGVIPGRKGEQPQYVQTAQKSPDVGIKLSSGEVSRQRRFSSF